MIRVLLLCAVLAGCGVKGDPLPVPDAEDAAPIESPQIEQV